MFIGKPCQHHKTNTQQHAHIIYHQLRDPLIKDTITNLHNCKEHNLHRIKL